MSIKFKTGEKQIEVTTYRMLNLLAHTQLEDLPTGSRCGGHGVCGGDRVRIRAQDRMLFSPPTQIEKKHLSESDIENGLRLACQCYPSQDDLDLEIEIIF